MGMPFIVGSSGVLPSEQGAEYAAINGNGLGHGENGNVPGSATWKRMQQDRGAGWWAKSIAWIRDTIDRARNGEGIFPLKGLTLMKVWIVAQAWFAIAMLCSW